MLTRCNHCEACFQINERLVRENDATVACGECGNVFDARLSLVDEYSGEYYQLAEDRTAADVVGHAHHQPGNQRIAAESDDYWPEESQWLPDESDVTPEPERSVLDQIGGVEAPYAERHDVDEYRAPADEQAASSLASHASDGALPEVHLEDYPALANDLLDHKRIESPVSAQPVAPAQDTGAVETAGSTASPWSWLLPIALLLTGILVTAVSYRDWIAQSSLPRPARAVFCNFAGCELPVQQAVDQLSIISKTSYSHPTVDDALIITIDILNKADFAQPYPSLTVIMADEQGRTVAQRDFTSGDYLSAEFSDKLLPPGTPVRIDLEVVDPGLAAQSFEISLF